MSALTIQMPRVYPRVCGGTLYTSQAAAVIAGLSPRVRGNPVGHLPGVALERSIPACAGEPAYCPKRRRYSGVYPRVCGGTVYSIALA